MIQVLQLPNADGALFTKMTSPTEQVEFWEHSSMLDMRTHKMNTVTTLATIPMDLVAHRYWRVRQQAGITYFDTSADGMTYFTHVETTFITSQSLSFELGGGVYMTITNGGSGQLDSAVVTGP